MTQNPLILPISIIPTLTKRLSGILLDVKHLSTDTLLMIHVSGWENKNTERPTRQQWN